MLLRASVAALKAGQVSKRQGYIAIVMRHYPRFTPKELSDEYTAALAPTLELFSEFKGRARALKDHNAAFEAVDYQRRFALSEAGLRQLARLSALAEQRDVYLICQCTHAERCHCDLLLIAARHLFGIQVAQRPFDYPEFEKRYPAAAE